MEHLIIATILALVITLIKGPGPALIIVLMLCLGKELFDLIFNPWNLKQIDLIDDSINDMIFNIIGMFTGIFVGIKK